MVIDNGSSLEKIVTIFIVAKETFYAAHKPIVNVFVVNVCHVGHIG
jgi:hypothetical protein